MKGLLLNNELGMWDATLAGIKTNTRRSPESLKLINEHPDNWKLLREGDLKNEKRRAFFMQSKTNQALLILPRYYIGETVFLQEPTMSVKRHAQTNILYKYKDKEGDSDEEEFPALIAEALKQGEGWQNKMFMPERLARYFIKITDVKLERIADISVHDAIAEGIQQLRQSRMQQINDGILYRDYSKKLELLNSGVKPKKSYETLIKKIHGPDIWDRNEWVFSYHYQLI